jgi:CobQ-like glutamine amidotransferase family enzyme
MKLTIAWLYGHEMNIYGDLGNVRALEQRARWRDLDTRIITTGVGDPMPEADLYFWGGGQDQEQFRVAYDLQGANRDTLKRAVRNGAALLAICGGYQLLGHEYRPHDADPLPGISLFDAVTEAGPERFIGNVIVDTSAFGPLVGFENHSGLTHLGPQVQPLGAVRVGRGNNGRDGTEGAIEKHAIGCYLHGSLLPKNPALADWLISAAIARGSDLVPLAPLNDEIEQAAHASAMERAIRTH